MYNLQIPLEYKYRNWKKLTESFKLIQKWTDSILNYHEFIPQVQQLSMHGQSCFHLLPLFHLPYYFEANLDILSFHHKYFNMYFLKDKDTFENITIIPKNNSSL